MQHNPTGNITLVIANVRRNLNLIHWRQLDQQPMRLSEFAKSLINRLYEKPRIFQHALGKSGWKVDILEQLVDCGEPAAIPFISPMLVTGTRDEIIIGARAIEVLLSKTAPEDLVWLDERMRDSWVFGSPYYEHWRKLTPRELVKWVGPGEPGKLLLRLSSFHSNGYVREEAVRRLSLIEDGSELPYLLLRLNDWVFEVRNVANRAVFSRIQSSYIAHFINNLALVTRLERARRADHTHIIEAVSQLLSQPASRPLLLAGVGSSSKIVRRACFHFLTANKPHDLRSILLQALDVKDPVIRLWATRLIGTTLPGPELAAVLPRLSKDHFVPVRREALRLWVDAFPTGAEDQLLFALLDVSRAVREEARFHLHRISGLDLAQFYRDALNTSSSKMLVTAVSGLAETGSPADAELVLAYLSHPVAKVRRTSAQCLIKLGGKHYVQMVLSMVLDVSPGVSAQARKAITPYASTVGAVQLWALFEKATFPHTQMNLLRLAAALPKWESISYLILAASHEDQAVATMAASYVVRWNVEYNRSQSTPSRDQLIRIEEALSHSVEALTDATMKAIRFAVDSFKWY